VPSQVFSRRIKKVMGTFANEVPERCRLATLVPFRQHRGNQLYGKHLGAHAAQVSQSAMLVGNVSEGSGNRISKKTRHPKCR
jgi:hypothetical protein